MAGGDGKHGMEPAAAEMDKFPEGMRVLAVDDNLVCLRVLETTLRRCKYEPTMVMDGETALKLLRERREHQFDLVITDVHMPDMDGFKLLELIGLEMDLPVIMLSADESQETVYKGIAHGACDYLVKPTSIKELKNIWQHVVRKNLGTTMNHNSSDSDDADARVVQLVIVGGEKGGAKGKKLSKKKKNDGDGSAENIESKAIPATQKKPRVKWNGELHRRFLEIVNRLGAEKAYPKTILQMMNVDYLTRASVASHLQKYRLYLKKVNDDPTKYNLLGESSEWGKSTSYMDMDHHGSLRDHYDHQRGQPSSGLSFQDSNNVLATPSVLQPHGVPIQSSNWSMGTVSYGGSMLKNVVPLMPDARFRASGPPVESFANKEYANFLREERLEARNVVPSSHPAGNSFANMPNSGMLAPSTVGGCRHAQFTYHVGNSSNPWQNVASSSFRGPMGGAPLISSQVNIPQMNQLPSFGASPGQMPLFQNEQQNQMVGIINNTTPLAGFNDMTNGNFVPMTQIVNGGSTSSTLPNLQTGSSVAPSTQMVSSVAPTQMLNGGDASGILPVQEGPANQQALEDQPTYSGPFFQEDIFSSMPN